MSKLGAKLFDDEDEGDVSRAPRVTRDAAERPKTWKPASAIPEPDMQPGYRYRWVRASVVGADDPSNVSKKLREGWEPVRVEEQPHDIRRDRSSHYVDNVEVGGLLLCKVPTDIADQRRAYYEQLNKRQVESVDNHYMRENDPRMPLFRERQTQVSFGNGN